METPRKAMIGGAGALLVGVLAFAAARAPTPTPPPPVVDPAVAQRTADSLSVQGHVLTFSDSTPAAAVFNLDRRIHANGYAIPHAAVHHRATDVALDSGAALLKPGPRGWGKVSDAEKMIGEGRLPLPVSAQQRARATQLRARLGADRKRLERTVAQDMAQARVASIRERAGCKPSAARIRNALAKGEAGGWSDNVIASIACRYVQIGFTEEQAVAAWGRPRDINRTTYSFGVHEQWVYDGGYLYFEDGVLRTIQN